METLWIILTVSTHKIYSGLDKVHSHQTLWLDSLPRTSLADYSSQVLLVFRTFSSQRFNLSLLFLMAFRVPPFKNQLIRLAIDLYT